MLLILSMDAYQQDIHAENLKKKFIQFVKPSMSSDRTVITAQKKEQILYLFFTVEKEVS
ncbi:hypothetical protein J2799_000177 [Chryseobacterium vietnamense]|uniref:hypothetical protein n=1 Tax=Chryseobacterium vietnamense TaxID=866785 RepID=UPI0028545194|nr:hypothetical protein [Chryseobacterium vietnamense]MDR6485692.1 hypothetical protein [Chryseobacterium vietnamense]